LERRPNDEVGVLTDSLNTMLESLKEKRIQLEEYARTLERRVRERTADLVSSEEKYRKLVENLPLIVYRILEDGTTEFINPYFTEKLGYSPEEVVGDRMFWREKICGLKPSQKDPILDTCWEEGKEYRTERVVRDKNGNLSTFIDQAIPMRDPQGRIRWIDGIMVDITELKALQERAVRTEEIRVLGEISARFAHELRNPLATVGGFARRLYRSFPEDDERQKLAGIVVDEVGRLESLLRIMLSSIEPITLCISNLDLNRILRESLSALRPRMEEKGVCIVDSLSEALPQIQGDEELLSRAFDNLLSTTLVSIPDREELFVGSERTGDRVRVTVRHKAAGLAEEDLGQFFIPRLAGTRESEVEDLPLTKVIIHRHGGKIDLSRTDEDLLRIRIDLPIRLEMGDVLQEDPGGGGAEKG
jgi:PAS domain S-box-containing protein